MLSEEISQKTRPVFLTKCKEYFTISLIFRKYEKGYPLLKEFYTKYFLLDLSEYFPSSASVHINEILFFLFLGFGIAALIAGWQKRTVYRGIRALLRHHAVGEENAMTATQLGIAKEKEILRALGDGGILRKTVAVRGEVRPTYDEYLAEEQRRRKNKEKKEAEDLSEKAFYLPEGQLVRAKRIYEKGAPSTLATLLFLPLMLLLYVGVALLMPSLLRLLASLF